MNEQEVLPLIKSMKVAELSFQNLEPSKTPGEGELCWEAQPEWLKEKVCVSVAEVESVRGLNPVLPTL